MIPAQVGGTARTCHRPGCCRDLLKQQRRKSREWQKPRMLQWRRRPEPGICAFAEAACGDAESATPCQRRRPPSARCVRRQRFLYETDDGISELVGFVIGASLASLEPNMSEVASFAVIGDAEGWKIIRNGALHSTHSSRDEAIAIAIADARVARGEHDEAEVRVLDAVGGSRCIWSYRRVEPSTIDG